MYRKTHGTFGKPIKVVMAIFSNWLYGEIASISDRRYGVMIDSCHLRGEVCQVRGCTEICRCFVSVRGCTVTQWRGDGTAAQCNIGAPGVTVTHQVSRWRVRCHWMCTWCHGDTVAACLWQVARWDGVAGGKVGWWLGGTVFWLGDGTKAQREGGMVAQWSFGDHVHYAMETRSPYKCSSYAHIVLIIILQFVLKLILY